MWPKCKQRNERSRIVQAEFTKVKVQGNPAAILVVKYSKNVLA
jgi:hypothetical protein